jgi:hypothetical protein
MIINRITIIIIKNIVLNKNKKQWNLIDEKCLLYE